MLKENGIVVVPHAGTWIEIMTVEFATRKAAVVPHAGTWIEMLILTSHNSEPSRRSPRGNVD